MAPAAASRSTTCVTATRAPPARRPSRPWPRGQPTDGTVPGCREDVPVTNPFGRLDAAPVLDRLELVAPVVAAAVRSLPPPVAAEVLVAPIDPELADTAAFCAAYDVALD